MARSKTDDKGKITTVVLVGQTGSGKSATGNSILGRKAFLSAGVTSTCEMHSTILKDGRTVNVIDTSDGSKFIGNEIVRCFNMAKDGIHAVLMVFSVRSPFPIDAEPEFQRLQIIFGERIVNHMIVVFTGGDALEQSGKKLQEYIDSRCPKSLQKIIKSCKKRVTLFDNETTDEDKRAEQVKQLLSYVDSVGDKNDGQPFLGHISGQPTEGSSTLLDRVRAVEAMQHDMKKQISKLKNEMTTVKQESKQTTDGLANLLTEEQAARLKEEKRLDDNIRGLREDLEKAQRDINRYRREAECCAIL